MLGMTVVQTPESFRKFTRGIAYAVGQGYVRLPLSGELADGCQTEG